jgi:DNA transposition AAA+ family ATPase
LVGATPGHRRLQAAVARGLTRFVGRDQELAALTQAQAQAAQGQGQVVALLGEAGVGKVAAGVRVCPQPRYPGLARAGERLGILR